MPVNSTNELSREDLLRQLELVGNERLRAEPHDDPEHYMHIYAKMSRDDGALMLAAAKALATP